MTEVYRRVVEDAMYENGIDTYKLRNDKWGVKAWGPMIHAWGLMIHLYDLAPFLVTVAGLDFEAGIALANAVCHAEGVGYYFPGVKLVEEKEGSTLAGA